MNIIDPEEFKAFMDALTTRIKGGDYHECDPMTVNMYYQSVAVRMDSLELVRRFNHLYAHWSHYRLPSPDEWLKAGGAHEVNAEAYRAFKSSDPPLLTSGNSSDTDKLEQAKQNRIKVLAAIYESQGETNFYKAMLNGRSHSWGGMVAKLTGHSGVITHDEVMNQVAFNASTKSEKRRVTSF
ncbi:MAG: hypothetical protein AAFR31_19990 [Cyanobacteria bacterium J06627_8]